LAWQEVDWLLIVLSAGLTLFGGLMIRSVELTRDLQTGGSTGSVGGIGACLMLFMPATGTRT